MKDPFKVRVTKSDKKAKKGLYTQKHIRLKQETLNKSKTNQKDHGSIQTTKCSLQSV
jgi:hypothetical protein